jgi:hypothetical protein
LSDDIYEKLKATATQLSISVECYCVRILMNQLLDAATPRPSIRDRAGRNVAA